MARKVVHVIADELREMIGAVVEQKLVDLFGDPDEGLVLTKTMRGRLIRQKRAVARGERGEPLEDVMARLKLA